MNVWKGVPLSLFLLLRYIERDIANPSSRGVKRMSETPMLRALYLQQLRSSIGWPCEFHIPAFFTIGEVHELIIQDFFLRRRVQSVYLKKFGVFFQPLLQFRDGILESLLSCRMQ